MGDLYILHHLFILCFLNWTEKMGKQKVKIQIHQIETPDYSPLQNSYFG